MKKKIMSILLSCFMAFGTGNPIHAEELTGVSSPESILPDSSVEEQTADTDYTAYQDEMLIDTDQVQPDFSDEAFPNEIFSFPGDSIPNGSFPEEELLSDMTVSSDESHVPGLPSSIDAVLERLCARTASENLLSSVGASADAASAFSGLANYITSKGTYNSDYGQYYIQFYDDESAISWYIYYDPQNVRLEFYTEYTATDDHEILVEMFIYKNMPSEVTLRIHEYLKEDDEDPYDIFVCRIPEPASYIGNETFTFSLDKSSMSASINAAGQKTCNLILQLAFAGWNVLVPVSGETLQSLGFSSFGGSKQASLSAPVITGFYNSVKGADLRWSKVTGATDYAIYRKRSSEGTVLVGYVNSDCLQFYDTDIQKDCWGRVYVYYIVPMKDSLPGPKSNEVTLQRLAPMKFTSLTSSSAGQVSLKWACTVSSNKANGYEIQYAASKTDLSNRSGSFKKISVDGRNNLSKTITCLSKTTTYYFRVRCYVNYTHSVTGKQTKTWSQYSDVLSIKPTGSASAAKTYRALLIGNSDYREYEENLNGPKYTTQAMKGMLKNYGYSSVTVKENLTASQIISNIRSAFSKASSDDVSLFFFDGHGETRTGALEGVDGRSVYLSTLANTLKEVPGKVVIILENCGSGGGVYKAGNSANGAEPALNGSSGETSELAPGGSSVYGESGPGFDSDEAEFDPELFNRQVIDAFAAVDPGLEASDNTEDLLSDGSLLPQAGLGELRNSKFLVLTATTRNEESWEFSQDGSSIWGGALTRAITEAAGCTFPTGSYKGPITADTNKDKKLTLHELFTYVKPCVTEMVRKLKAVQHVSCYPENSNGVIMIKS